MPQVESGTQAIDPRLIELHACPVSKEPVTFDGDARSLVSPASGRAYPVRQGIPIMLASEARDVAAAGLEAVSDDAAIGRDSYYERVTKYSPERVAPFNLANRRLPSARETERRLLVERLDLQPDLIVVDTGSGGGYVADSILPLVAGDKGAVVCTDTAEHFIASIPEPFLKLVFGMDAFALRDSCADRVSNLAGLHHVERKAAFFAESFRVLKPGGLAAAADVLADTAPARWLNGAVDRMTDIGHDGMFVHTGEFSQLMADAGFVDIEESYETYDWCFPDKREMVSFARDLFRLTRASLEEVERALYDSLTVKESNGAAAFEWGLLYVTGRKP